MRSGKLGFLGSFDAGIVDPYWANVQSRLPFDGADGSTSIIDKKGRIWTPSGDAQLDTAQSRFGGSSLLLDGTGDKISTPSDAGLQLATQAFTLEGHIRPSTLSGNANVVAKVAAGNGAWTLYRIGSTLRFYASSNGTAWDIVNGMIVGTLAVNAWAYFKVLRSGSAFSAGLEGVAGGTATSAASIRSNTAAMVIGGDATTGTELFAGHVDDFRLTVGEARPGFTVPTEAFPVSG